MLSLAEPDALPDPPSGPSVSRAPSWKDMDPAAFALGIPRLSNTSRRSADCLAFSSQQAEESLREK